MMFKIYSDAWPVCVGSAAWNTTSPMPTMRCSPISTETTSPSKASPSKSRETRALHLSDHPGLSLITSLCLSGFSRNRARRSVNMPKSWWNTRCLWMRSFSSLFYFAALSLGFFLIPFPSLWSVLCWLFFFWVLQNKRGGKVKLQSILMPLSEFDHEEKGDALYGKLGTWWFSLEGNHYLD